MCWKEYHFSAFLEYQTLVWTRVHALRSFVLGIGRFAPERRRQKV